MVGPDYVVVIGASEGGLNALTEIIPFFNKEMNAAVLVVMHLSPPTMADFIVDKLKSYTAFTVLLAEDGQHIRKRHIYIAPPNNHLLVNDTSIIFGRGPAENDWRPSINILLRSAAASWSNRAIGVILTGLLNDGTTGMQAIKKSGGICLVQDPSDAEYPEMPLNVLKVLAPDHILPLAGIGMKLVNITSMAAPQKWPAPEKIKTEARIATEAYIDYEYLDKLGQVSKLACPTCGGSLYSIKNMDGEDRFRCHIGHAFTEKQLLIKQTLNFESTLWIALRMLQERKTLIKTLQNRSAAKD